MIAHDRDLPVGIRGRYTWRPKLIAQAWIQHSMSFSSSATLRRETINPEKDHTLLCK